MACDWSLSGKKFNVYLSIEELQDSPDSCKVKRSVGNSAVFLLFPFKSSFNKSGEDFNMGAGLSKHTAVVLQEINNLTALSGGQRSGRKKQQLINRVFSNAQLTGFNLMR